MRIFPALTGNGAMMDTVDLFMVIQEHLPFGSLLENWIKMVLSLIFLV